MWDGHLESRKNPDRLKRSIHVDRIGVHSTFVYIYAELRALMIWANCLFSFHTSFLLRKVEDVTTISKSQSLTSVSIIDCTLRVPDETTTLFLLRVIIKAIFIHTTPVPTFCPCGLVLSCAYMCLGLCLVLVRWSVICCQDGCFMVRQRRIARRVSQSKS